ncbi:MAG: hypothetical protein U0992_00730 [Planctomycetaceae bacterium]
MGATRPLEQLSQLVGRIVDQVTLLNQTPIAIEMSNQRCNRWPQLSEAIASVAAQLAALSATAAEVQEWPAWTRRQVRFGVFARDWSADRRGGTSCRADGEEYVLMGDDRSPVVVADRRTR